MIGAARSFRPHGELCVSQPSGLQRKGGFGQNLCSHTNCEESISPKYLVWRDTGRHCTAQQVVRIIDVSEVRQRIANADQTFKVGAVIGVDDSLLLAKLQRFTKLNAIRHLLIEA
jgi:hypothetical protein